MKTTIKMIVFVIPLIFCFLSACRILGGCDDNKMEMSRTNNTGSELNIQGYYYGDLDDKSNLAGDIFYFYSNGVVFAPGSSNLDEARAEILPSKWPMEQSVIWDWGLYRIQGQRIEIEHWRPTQCGAKTFYESGKILTDTSFIIEYRETRDKNKVSSRLDRNAIFFFNNAVKPDSTNHFIQ